MVFSFALHTQTLYTYPENFRAYKALIAAQYSGAKVTLAAGFVFGETNKSDAFLKKFPAGKVRRPFYVILHFRTRPVNREFREFFFVPK